MAGGGEWDGVRLTHLGATNVAIEMYINYFSEASNVHDERR